MCRMVSFEGDKKVAEIKLLESCFLDLQRKNGAPNVRI